ncbi:MAG TPA: hypothetical protein VL100_04470 [Croceibacterium sp.]|nr:hypothetical protein [Croceibacterium sp.]
MLEHPARIDQVETLVRIGQRPGRIEQPGSVEIGILQHHRIDVAALDVRHPSLEDLEPAPVRAGIGIDLRATPGAVVEHPEAGFDQRGDARVELDAAVIASEAAETGLGIETVDG